MLTVPCSNGADIPVWMTKMELGIESPVSERSNQRNGRVWLWVLVSPGGMVALGVSQEGFSGEITSRLRLGNDREVGRYKLSLQTSWVRGRCGQ